MSPLSPPGIYAHAPAVVCVCVRSAGTDKPFSSAFPIPSFPLFLCSTDLLGHRGTWVIKMKPVFSFLPPCQTLPLFVGMKDPPPPPPKKRFSYTCHTHFCSPSVPYCFCLYMEFCIFVVLCLMIRTQNLLKTICLLPIYS